MTQRPHTPPPTVWTRTPPTELADYWYWTGDPDRRPQPLSVIGQLGPDGFCCTDPEGGELPVRVLDLEGWWMPLPTPALPCVAKPDPGLLAQLQADNLRYKTALARIAKWHDEFPPTGKTWEDGRPMPFLAVFGTYGQRDYMRGVAASALTQLDAPTPGPHSWDWPEPPPITPQRPTS